MANSKAASWLNKYLTKNPSSTNENIRAVAYMMDTNIWKTYAGENAEWAIGGPTLELFCESYKDTHPDKYIENEGETSTNGCNVKWNTDSSYTNYADGLSTTKEYNCIYIQPDTTKASAMWLAAPSSAGTEYMLCAHFQGTVYGGFPYWYNGPGLRPLVCLSSGVQLEEQSDGIFAIK